MGLESMHARSLMERPHHPDEPQPINWRQVDDERNALARLLFMADNHDMPADEAAEDWVVLCVARKNDTYAHRQADAVLAAGYRKEDA